MYTLYTDQSEVFEATISVSGTSLSETKCRLMIESDVINLAFTGILESDGNCRIPIRALSKFFPEGTTGNMKLEVIAESTYFIPWESEFVVKTQRKVTAEVKTPRAAVPIIEAKATLKSTKPTVSPHVENVTKILRKSLGLKESKQRLTAILADVGQYVKKHSIKEAQFESILNEAFTHLKQLEQDKKR